MNRVFLNVSSILFLNEETSNDIIIFRIYTILIVLHKTFINLQIKIFLEFKLFFFNFSNLQLDSGLLLLVFDNDLLFIYQIVMKKQIDDTV